MLRSVFLRRMHTSTRFTLVKPLIRKVPCPPEGKATLRTASLPNASPPLGTPLTAIPPIEIPPIERLSTGGPLSTEPVSTEPVSIEPLSTETPPTDTLLTETLSTEPLSTEPSSTEPLLTETLPTETWLAETSPTDTLSTETLPIEALPTEIAAKATPPTATPPADTSPDEDAPPVPGAATRTRSPPLDALARPYFVGRTHSNNLPVFHEKKGGGNQLWTVVKKGQGDVPALADHVAEALDLPRATVKINPVNNHIKIKGYHKDRVTQYLEKIGF